MPKIEPIPKEQALAYDAVRDSAGYVAVANLGTGGKLLHLSINTPDGIKGFPCTMDTAIAFKKKFGPVENLYVNNLGQGVVTDILANIRAIASSLRPGASYPEKYWTLMEPRGTMMESMGRQDAAVLYSIRKNDGLYRYVLYASVEPCMDNGLFRMGAAGCRLVTGPDKKTFCRAGTPSSGSVLVGGQALAYKFLRSIWQLELSRRATPTQPLPPAIDVPGEIGDTPRTRDEWSVAYAFTGSRDWATLRTLADDGGRAHASRLDPAIKAAECALWALDTENPVSY